MGIVLEFKIPQKKESLAQAAQRGLEQAIANQYVTELASEDYTDFLVVGVSLRNKNISWSWVRGSSCKELNEKFKHEKN